MSHTNDSDTYPQNDERNAVRFQVACRKQEKTTVTSTASSPSLRVN